MSNPEQRADKREDKCVAELAREAVVVMAILALFSVFSSTVELTARRMAAFFVMYVGLAWFLQEMDPDFAQATTRVVGFQLGSKLFGILTA